MPHIRVRALEKNQVQKLSVELIPALAKELQTPVDHFTLEWVSSVFYAAGSEVSSYPFIEVHWFARPPPIQDRLALLITQQVKSLIGDQDVVVVFKTLERAAYYENGKHF